MNNYNPSDFTGEKDVKETQKSTRRNFVKAASVGGFSLGLGYLTVDESGLLEGGDDEYVCIHEQVLTESDFGEEGSFEPNSDGYHKFRYDSEEDIWYEQEDQGLVSETKEREADTETINWMLENAGEDGVYNDEEVLENCDKER